jgi:hypothetical protein
VRALPGKGSFLVGGPNPDTPVNATRMHQWSFCMKLAALNSDFCSAVVLPWTVQHRDTSARPVRPLRSPATEPRHRRRGNHTRQNLHLAQSFILAAAGHGQSKVESTPLTQSDWGEGASAQLTENMPATLIITLLPVKPGATACKNIQAAALITCCHNKSGSHTHLL